MLKDILFACVRPPKRPVYVTKILTYAKIVLIME
jgi:hypothetical protein